MEREPTSGTQRQDVACDTASLPPGFQTWDMSGS